MVIRRADPNDISVIVDFQQKMAFETEQLLLDYDILQKGVQKVFADPTKGFYIVTEEGKKVIASMLLTPEWSDWRNSTFLWIQSLYVEMEFREKGVFKKMYKYVKQLIQSSEKYAGIKLYVDKNNNRAREVYFKVGMEKSHYQLYEWNKNKL